jgi:hypothetical protein
MKEKLLKVAHGCTVHQSVIVAPTIDIKLGPPTQGRAVHQS